MKYFDTFSSNTAAGSANQHFFISDEKEHIGRLFFKIRNGGKFNYSLLFSNIIDSTYADGSISHKNLICDEWEIFSLKIGRADTPDVNSAKNFKEITFDGKNQKSVLPGEFFCTDPISLDFRSNEYLCMEISFKGKMIPYHEESIISAFVMNSDGNWGSSKKLPFPAMIGCDRQTSLRIGYLGDSITQGIGTPVDSYKHWNAVLSDMLGSDYSYWNLGIGYGRADDAASDGSWLFKAKQNDMVVVCFGVNDILRGFTAEQIIKNLTSIVDKLHHANVKVLLQTVPPFNYSGDNIEKWNKVNNYIHNVLCNQAEMIFDTVPILQLDSGNPHMCKYPGHPDIEGCRVWAEALLPFMKQFISNHF